MDSHGIVMIQIDVDVVQSVKKQIKNDKKCITMISDTVKDLKKLDPEVSVKELVSLNNCCIIFLVKMFLV